MRAMQDLGYLMVKQSSGTNAIVCADSAVSGDGLGLRDSELCSCSMKILFSQG
jgi:hypothetical protein